MRTFSLLLLALLAGCSQSTTSGSADAGASALLGAPDGPPVAVVNGEVISEPLLVVFARKALCPVAVPWEAVVFCRSASTPVAVLPSPESLSKRLR